MKTTSSVPQKSQSRTSTVPRTSSRSSRPADTVPLLTPTGRRIEISAGEKQFIAVLLLMDYRRLSS